MKFEVRKIRESDIEGFRAALDAVVSERKYLLTLETPSSQVIGDFVRANVENNYAQYVAEFQNEIIGWADIIPKQKEAVKHVGELGVGVIAEHRGKGIGKVLLQHVIEHSWENGLKRIELEVYSSNLDAVALYEKLGFEHEGTKRNDTLIDGRYEDSLIMAQIRL